MCRDQPRKDHLMRTLTTILLAAATLLTGSAGANAAVTSDLAAPDKKEIAMQLVSTAENSSLDWRAQFDYIQDIDDGRGYTAGIVGFCSGTGDMLQLVRAYKKAKPKNPLARFLPALRRVNGGPSHEGLGRPFKRAWHKAAKDPVFQAAQETLRDTLYFNPSVELAKADGLNALGQFAYYDAAVVHGFEGMQGVRDRALAVAATPAAGGDEVAYLGKFLDERNVEMLKEPEHHDLTRVETAQRRFLQEGNLDLHLPLYWSVYGDPFQITG
jgi:chitosanase